jgi:hypothetical protein
MIPITTENTSGNDLGRRMVDRIGSRKHASVARRHRVCRERLGFECVYLAKPESTQHLRRSCWAARVRT